MIISNNIDKYFKGEFQYPQDKLKNLTAFIDKVEKKTLTDFLGVQLSKQFFANLSNGLPTATKWQNFVSGTYYIDSYSEQSLFNGIEDFLQNICLFGFLEKFENFNTIGGVRNLDSKNSTKRSKLFTELQANEYYNEFVKEYKKAYYFLDSQNIDITKLADSFTDNTDGTFTFLAQDTEFLNQFSEVTISGIIYEVQTVVTSTSFIINAVTGTIFDLNFEYKKYGNLATLPKQRKTILEY